MAPRVDFLSAAATRSQNCMAWGGPDGLLAYGAGVNVALYDVEVIDARAFDSASGQQNDD